MKIIGETVTRVGMRNDFGVDENVSTHVRPIRTYTYVFVRLRGFNVALGRRRA